MKAIITDKYGAPGCNVGEDGGLAPNISRHVVFLWGSSLYGNMLSDNICICSFREGLDLVKEAISRTEYKEKLKIAIDVAATEFCIGDVQFLDIFL